jgi:hypothetical protein
LSIQKSTTISPANPDKDKEPTSGLEPLTCSLRVSCSTC